MIKFSFGTNGKLIILVVPILKHIAVFFLNFFFFLQCVAFKDVSPQAPVHFLVVPKKCLERLDSAEDRDEQVGLRGQSCIRRGYGDNYPYFSIKTYFVAHH